MIPLKGTHKCIGTCPHFHRNNVVVQYEDYGPKPARGGNGGQGGVAGIGGYGGLAKITRLDDSLVNKFQDLLTKNGNEGPKGKDGEGGAGSSGGRQYRCTRRFHHKSERCCKKKRLGICVNYGTCTRIHTWLNDLENKFVAYSAVNGIKPPTKNSNGRKP